MTWSLKSLDELGTVGRGRSRHRPRDSAHLYGGPYPFIQTSDIKHANLYVTEYTQTYSEAGLAQSKLWKAGTLCITIAANIADTAILGIDACFPDSVIGFIPDPAKTNARFIKYLFDAILQQQFQQFTQGAAQDNLSETKLLSLKFCIPDVDIQIRIADILSTYDIVIENNRRRIQLLEQAARLLYREWFVALRFPGYEHIKIVNGIPEGWVRCLVRDVVTYLNRGITPKYNDDAPGIIINQRCIRNGLLNLTLARHQSKQIPKDKLIRFGDVLVNSTGEGTLGRVAQVIFEIDNCTVDSHVTIVRPSSKVGVYYFGMCMQNTASYLGVMGRGATNQTELASATIENIAILIPSPVLAGKFEDISRDIFTQINNLINQNIKLSHARDLLLPRLMNGEIAV